jgi:hypothetical protein
VLEGFIRYCVGIVFYYNSGYNYVGKW